MKHVTPNLRPALRGFSLIELLVAMAIGLVVTLAITQVMIGFDRSKRSSTAVNDSIQAGAYGGYLMDRAIRQAGTGYTQRLNELFGCRLNVSRSGAVILPPPTPFPAPFAAASAMRRLAPFLIEQGAADTGSEVRGDILTVMSGSGGNSELPLLATSFTLTPTPQFNLPLAIEYKAGSLVLVGGDQGGTRDCMVQQVINTFVSTGGVTVLPLGGDYYTPTGTTVADLTSFTAGTAIYATQIGNITTTPPRPPLFQMFGVGDKATLFRYDLLRTGSTPAEVAPQPISDNIVEIRALYGLDTDIVADHSVNSWQSPGVAPFRYVDLTDGSVTAKNNLKRIMGVRLGLILRSSLKESSADHTPSPAPVLFAGVTNGGGTSLEYTRTLAGDDSAYRYRAIELMIPLRNMQFAPLP